MRSKEPTAETYLTVMYYTTLDQTRLDYSRVFFHELGFFRIAVVGYRQGQSSKIHRETLIAE